MKKLKRLILTAMTFLLIFALFACVGGECVSHIDVDKNAKCDLCAIDVECTSCIDVDKNARCDVCGNKVACTQCVDVDQNYKCDVCGKKIVCKSCVDKNPTDAKCDLCGKSLESETNDNNSYSISGINFILPKYMKEIEVSASYADIAYGTLDDRTLEFTIYFYSKNELLSELLLDTESTVEQYANWFVAMNEYQNIERSYDEEGRKITLRYVYEDGSEGYFFYDYIIRNEYMLYHVTMSCNPEDRAIYEPLFDEWAKAISLSY